MTTSETKSTATQSSASTSPAGGRTRNPFAAVRPSPTKRFHQGNFTPFITMSIFAAFGLLLDQTANAYTQLIILYIGVNVILALGLNLVNGFTGQFSIGHAGFMAIGAYTSAYLSMNPMLREFFLGGPFEAIGFLLFAYAGGLVAAAAGWLVGLPSLRLRGDYLAIVTLGFGEIIRVLLLNTPAVGGARGMFGIPGPGEVELFGFTLSPFFVMFLLTSFWVMTMTLFIARLAFSTHGRAFFSVREDEIAAQAMGIDTTGMKVRAFVISSFFAGVAGSIFAHAAHYLNPSTFGFTKSVDVIIMVVLGGMGSITGSIVAAIIVTILPEFVLRPLQEFTGIDLRMVIYSLALIIFMIVRPQGIFGHHELPELWRWLRKGAKT